MTTSSPLKKAGKIILKGAGIILALLLIIGLFNIDRLTRLYRVVTLFEPDRIDKNFRSLGELFESRRIRHGDKIFRFRRDPKKLPPTYTWQGKEKDLQKWITHTSTTGMIVVKDDTILFEKYYRGNNEKSPAISWSVAKSFVSALFGIAIEEGHIKSISEPVTAYAPFLKKSGYNNITIKNVLQMSSGIRFNEDYGDFDSDINRMGRAFALNKSFDDFVVTLKNEKEQGTYNHYVSMDTQVLGIVLREATKKSLSALLEEKIWKPCGMEADAFWLIDSDGMEAAFCGLNVVLRDYARFGRLFLKKGKWQGRQVVPRQWVIDSVTPDAPHLMPGKNPLSSWVLGYGYQWWIPENPDGDFLAIGVYGQFIYIYPKYNIVIAKTSAYADYNKDGDAMERETIEMFRAIARKMK